MHSRNLPAAVAAHAALKEQIRQAFPDADDRTLGDSLDSVTELDAAIVAVVRHAIEIDLLSAALAERIRELSLRKKRYDDSAATMRGAVLHAMLAAGWKRLPAPVPDFTVTVGDGTPKLVITDEAAIPFDLLEVVSKPNRAAIKNALKSGREVNGASFGNAAPHLIISRR